MDQLFKNLKCEKQDLDKQKKQINLEEFYKYCNSMLAEIRWGYVFDQDR